MYEQQKKYRDTHPDKVKEINKNYRDTHKEQIKEYSATPEQVAQRSVWYYNHPREALIYQSRVRAKRDGVEHTINVSDIEWSTHCPMLGLPLAYRDKPRVPKRACALSASLDRRDNTKGYIPGNVFVLSTRANRAKSDFTIEQIQNLLNYMKGTAGGL